jgi:hypothetical protein
MPMPHAGRKAVFGSALDYRRSTSQAGEFRLWCARLNSRTGVDISCKEPLRYIVELWTSVKIFARLHGNEL